MSDTDLDDGELLARAREGDAPAFAVLVHRHAATLHAAASASSGSAAGASGATDAASGTTDAASDTADAASGTTDAAGDPGGGAAALTTVRRTFLRAMRRLDRADPTDVEGWLLEVQGTPLDADAAARAAPLASAELDELWRELAPRWPRGRRKRRLPRWIAQVALVLVLLALAVAVPYALLVTAVEEADPSPDPIAEVVGVPIVDDQFDLTFEDAGEDDAGEDDAGEDDLDPGTDVDADGEEP